jgi:hypothetical protein
MIRVAKIGEDEVDDFEIFAVRRSPDGCSFRKMASAAVVRDKVNVRLRLPAGF